TGLNWPVTARHHGDRRSAGTVHGQPAPTGAAVPRPAALAPPGYHDQCGDQPRGAADAEQHGQDMPPLECTHGRQPITAVNTAAMETGLNWPVTATLSISEIPSVGAAMETGLNWPVTAPTRLAVRASSSMPQWRPALIGRLRST